VYSPPGKSTQCKRQQKKSDATHRRENQVNRFFGLGGKVLDGSLISRAAASSKAPGRDIVSRLDESPYGPQSFLERIRTDKGIA